MKNAIFSITSLLVYFILAHAIMEIILNILWKYLNEPRNSHKLTASLGIIDRLVYAFCFALGIYSFIGIWLGVKVASRLLPTLFGVNDEKAFKFEGQRKNLYLMGNIISLFLGVVGGLLIRFLFTEQCIEISKYLFKNN